MLTGEVPYPKDGDIAKLWAHISNPPPQPSASRRDLLPVFDDIVAKATAKDRSERYATAGELSMAVREAVAQQQAHAGAAAPAMTYPPTPAPTAQPTEPPGSMPPASAPGLDAAHVGRPRPDASDLDAPPRRRLAPASTPPISTPPTPVSMPAASVPAA